MANKQTAHLLPPRHKVQEIGWVALLPFEQSARDVVLPGQEDLVAGKTLGRAGGGVAGKEQGAGGG